MSNLPFHECNVESFEDALMALDGSAMEQFDCDGFLDLLDGADGKDDDDAPAIEPIRVTSGGLISTNDTVEPPVEVTSAEVAAPPNKSKRNRKRPSMRSARSLSPPRKRSSVKDIRSVYYSPTEMLGDSCPEIFSEPNIVASPPPPVSPSTPPAEGPRDENGSANVVNRAEFERTMNKLAPSMQRSELSRRNLTGNLPVQQRPQQQQQRANTTPEIAPRTTERSPRLVPTPASAERATPQFQTLAGLSSFLDGTRPTLTAALEQSRKQLRAYGGRVSTGTAL